MVIGIALAFPTGFIVFLDNIKVVSSNLDNTIYSNLVLLGYAFQAGLIPLKLQSIFSAIKIN